VTIRRSHWVGGIIAVTCLVVSMLVVPAGATTQYLPDAVAGAMSEASLRPDLAAFGKQASEHGGTRAPGTAGFEASKDYVLGKLTKAGFDISVQSFPVPFSEAITERLTVAGAPVPGMHMMLYTKDTPSGGVTGKLAAIPAADHTPGCEPSDFAGADYKGAIVLIGRGVCTFAVKLANAAHAGAAAVVFYNDVDVWLRGSLGKPEDGILPSGGVSRSVGEGLRHQVGSTATLELKVFTQTRTGHTVIAQTRTGRPDNVIVAGAHLDSVVEGAGLNSDGSGAAALLETAVRLGGSPKIANAVRFIFWGSWEFGIVSSPYYVAHLNPAQQQNIAMYLNFDGIASPNAGYFVYDGHGPGSPPGSAQIQKALTDALAVQGVHPETIPMQSRFEHLPFVAAGIPAGGLHTGLIDLKTSAQAAKWGGRAGEPFDACYHEFCDTILNVNMHALVTNARAIARVIVSYAISTDDPAYGVPSRPNPGQ
jgi:Zn-dependent M28 family amino/carboxypeptidase